jgi:hypothetical protein
MDGIISLLDFLARFFPAQLEVRLETEVCVSVWVVWVWV